MSYSVQINENTTNTSTTREDKDTDRMDFSSGRVTTALSVHGTTLIPHGREVNDISSS
jgi:hypothetical protein